MTYAHHKKPSLLAAALLTLAGLAPLSAHALDIKLGHVLAPSHSWNKAAEGFAAEVKEKTAGRVNFVLFPSGQLGNEKTMLEGLQIGSQGAAIIGSGSLQPIEPKFAVVQHIADEIVVLQGGRVVERGPASQVYFEPVHPYTRQLIGATLAVPQMQELAA